MKGEDIPKPSGILIGDLELAGFGASCSATETSDQSIKLAVLHRIDAPEVGHNANARLAFVVAIRLHDLKVASATIARDAREHGLFDSMQNAFIPDL